MAIGDRIYADTDYAQMLLKLFPPGDAFPRSVKTQFYLYILGLAQELARLDLIANQFLKESDCENADQLLDEYDEDYGFPDDIFDIPDALADRQVQLLERDIFPSFLKTHAAPEGWPIGTITKGSNIIQVSIWDYFEVGDIVSFSSGFTAGGKYEILDKYNLEGDQFIIVDDIALADAADSEVTGYFNRAEPSERFFESVARWFDHEIVSFTYYDDEFRMGDYGMTDGIGDLNSAIVLLTGTFAPDSQLAAYLQKIKPAHITLVIEQES